MIFAKATHFVDVALIYYHTNLWLFKTLTVWFTIVNKITDERNVNVLIKRWIIRLNVLLICRSDLFEVIRN